MAAFRQELKAEFGFLPDPQGRLIRLFGVKTPLVTFAKRYTFVVGKDRKILSVTTGSSAIDPSGAMQACSLY